MAKSIKAASCPKCGSLRIIKIVYGFPGEELWQQEARGEIVIGGCVIDNDDPEFHCKDCGNDFGRRKKR